MSNNLLIITIKDFNQKAFEKQILSPNLIEDSKININNLTLLEYINILRQKGLLGVNEIDKILEEIHLGKSQIFQLNKSKSEYSTTSNNFEPRPFQLLINKNTIELYEEATSEEYKYDDFKNKIVIYDVDHEKSKIIVLIPAMTSEIFENLKKIKGEFKTVTEERKHLIKNHITGQLELQVKSLKSYGILFIITPLSIIDAIIDANRKTEKTLQVEAQKIEEQKNKSGFKDTSAYKNIQIIGEGDDNIQNILTAIFKEQEKKSASDIHFEPDLHCGSKDSGQIRIRVDGDLSEPYPIAKGFGAIIRDLKKMSNLNVNERYLPQDGKLVLKIEEVLEEFHYRLSTIPIGEQGQEKIVLRRLSNDTSYLRLDILGMDEVYRNIINSTIGNPELNMKGKFRDGMILMTGPTGSGKTTTLFAMLNQLNTNKVNIQTLEDPIEYNLPGINQSQINDASLREKNKEPYTYARGLRSILRQDPDIILVGEIRDEETMEVAKDAATTGHLLFSSLHTNNTWEALDRMLGLNFDVTMIGNTVRLIMAQRLGRVVCPHCMEEYNSPGLAQNSQDLEARIKRYNEIKLEIYRKMIDSPYLEFLPDKISDMKFYQGKGCINCDYTGEKGRMGIYEFMPISINIQNFILENGIKAPKDKVRELFIKEGITTLYQDALLKVFNGKKNKDGSISYMNYGSAISAAGTDLYEFGNNYKEYNIEQLEELLHKKKKDLKTKKLHLQLKELEFQTRIKVDEFNLTNNIEEKKKLEEELKLMKTRILKLKQIIQKEVDNNFKI